ncbi:MAG: chromosome segregation protein SMC [Cyclobacteriaceae bacterium]|nr:chromosome segregation protein SMC [Cyclobacteriaceae bacterium]
MTEIIKKPAVEKKKSNKVGFIVAVLSVIIILQSVKIFLDHTEKQELNQINQKEQADHAETMQRLTEISTELDTRIRELEKLGGDIEELSNAKAEIEKELKDTRTRTRSTIKTLQGKVGGYEELLHSKDEEIEKLKSINDQLFTENNDLKTEQNQLARTIVELNQEQTELQSKIEVASRLIIENVSILAISSRGRERTSPFRSNQIYQLKVGFNIGNNDVAPIEGKEIMLRVLDPQGNVIFDVAKGSGTFFYEGKEEFYTAKQEILFDNSEQQLSYLYEKGTEYESGEYQVEVYTDDYRMGRGSFQVK